MRSFITLFALLIFCIPLRAQSLKINEVLASNSSVNMDADGDNEDWIELYNGGTTTIALGGYSLSDDELLLQKWIFPNVNLAAGQYILVWASEKNRTVAGAPLHTNFKISAQGEKVLLTSPTGIIVDSLTSPDVPENISYGRKPNGTGTFFYFNVPTPSASNIQTGYTELMKAPDFSVVSGFYPVGFPLTLSTLQSGATIIYTLDGSEPDQANLGGTTYQYKNKYEQEEGQSSGSLINQSFTSLQYAVPLNIIDRTTLDNDIANIATTYHNVPYYVPTFKIFKNTVVRAKVVKAGALPSKSVTRNYFITPLGHSRFSLPVVSYTVNEDKFFDYNNGIYVPGVDFDDWREENSADASSKSDGNYKREDIPELVGNISYYVNGEEVINQKVGMLLAGNTSRNRSFKSIKVTARDEYSKNSLDYNFFNNGYDSHKRIILRNSGSDAYSTMFRDAFLQRTVRHLNVTTQNYQPTITFLNGEYWGIHNIRDHFDKFYMEQKFDIKENELDLLEKIAIPEVGDANHYLSLLSYIEDNNMSDNSKYDYVKTQMDIENFTDYQISEIYLGNGDWGTSNIRYWRKRTASYLPDAPFGHDGRWRWLLYDLDGGFGIWYSASVSTLSEAIDDSGDESTLILRSLVGNTNYRNYFLNRFADLINTTFVSSRMIGILDSMQAKIAPEMPEHIARWKTPATMALWNAEVEDMREYAVERPVKQRGHLQSEFNLSGTYTLTADVSSTSHGFIHLNTIDILPATPGIAANTYPWTGIYFRSIPIKLTATPKPGYMFSHWSGASSSTNAVLTITPTVNTSLTAHFVLDPNALPQPIYFFVFDENTPNNLPLESITAKYNASNQTGTLQFQSALQGYPFTPTDPLWRKASMERRNNPIDLNYRPIANNGVAFTAAALRGLQIRQPFIGNGGENTMIFSLPTVGFQNCIFTFAAVNEAAADQLLIDYSIDGTQWTTTGMAQSTLPLDVVYQLYTVNFTAVSQANNNSNFKIRIRFGGSNMNDDLGNRVTFNNICLDAQLFQSGAAGQTINFSALPDKPFNALPFTIAATASSGLPVSFAIVSGPATVTGNTISLTGATGTVTVKAIQSGNAQFSPAAEVTRSFQVTKVVQTISFDAIPDKLSSDVPFSVFAVATSGLQVGFSIVSGPATISGSTVTLLGIGGTVVVKATQGGNNQYFAATDVTRSFQIFSQAQSINFTNIPDKITTDAPFGITAVASSGLSVAFSVVTGPATVSGGIVTLNGTSGTVTIKATQAGNINFAAAPDVTKSFQVLKVLQIITFGALSNKITTDAPFTLSATASSGLAVSYSVISGPATVSGNAVTLTGLAGTVVIKAIQNGNGQYAAALDVTQSFVVSKATQTITFGALSNKITTDAPFALSATASSGLAVSYSVISGPATVSGNAVTLTGLAGTVVIKAVQNGNGQYAVALDVTQSFVVSKATQTITFGALSNKITTDAPFTLSATASSGLAVSYSVITGPATVSGNTVTLTGLAGTVVIKAVQNGNGQYAAALDVTQSFEVSKATQTITFGTLSNKITTDAPFTLSATASSGLAVSYSVITGPATVSGNTVTLTGLAGTVVIKAVQNGNGQYAAALDVTQSFEVSKATQTITFGTLSNKITTDAPFTLSATASSGLAVSYSVISGPATVNDNTVTLNGVVGAVVLQASQNGNNQYNVAPEVIRSFLVSLATQSINFEAISNKITTDAPFDIAATASSGLLVSFAVASGPATILDNTVTLAGTPGTVIIKANQSGNIQYDAAIEVEQSFEVMCSTADVDGDGICADTDCDDNNPSLPADEGSVCDDGNPFTLNDAIQADGCTCSGTVSTINIIADHTIKVAPNPSDHHIEVQSNIQFYQANLFSSRGLEVLVETYKDGISTALLDVQILPAGTYFLVLKFAEGERALVKVVKIN